MSRLRESVVIVTGAAQGIGAAIAATLGNAGSSVMLADIQAEKASAVAEHLSVAGHRTATCRVDVSDVQAVHAMVKSTIEAFGRVDALVNCAGIDSPRGHAWEIDEDHWRRVIDVDLTGQWWCTKAVIPHMIERRAGKIVFISSVAARAGSLHFSPAYTAAKAGIIGLTTVLSMQLEEFGILVNAVAPGTIGTTGVPLTSDEAREYVATYPLGFGGPQPVADAVRYLLDRSGDWLSGVVLNVSGGKWRGI